MGKRILKKFEQGFENLELMSYSKSDLSILDTHLKKT